jgi:hypothetical protein
MPLFIITLYFIKVRKRFDLALYLLLFALLVVLMEEWIYLRDILS